MNILVIYDSAYGNTRRVAEKIYQSLRTMGPPRLVSAARAKVADVRGAHLIFLGAPTQGGQPAAHLRHFLETLPPRSLEGTPIAAFDTRFALNDHGGGLKVLMKVIGFAAPKIAKLAAAKGGVNVVPPEGFVVTDKEGPLAPSELERAGDWAVETTSHVAHEKARP